MVSVVEGSLHDVCSAKVRRLGKKVRQSWRLHVHPQDSTKAAYVRNNGEACLRCSFSLEHSIPEEDSREH